jgi:hypothetical protein
MNYTITIPIDGDTATAVTLLTLKLDGSNVTQSPALPQAFTDAGSGSWTKEVGGITAGSSYAYTYRVAFGSNAFDLEGTFTADSESADVEWFYSNLASLEDDIGELNAKIISNQGGEDDTAVNTARVLRDGQTVDGIINMTLRGGTYVVPVTKSGVLLNATAASFETRALFRMFSNVLVAYMLNQHRMIIASNKTEFDQKISDARNDVMAMLAKIKAGEFQIDADLDTDDTDEPDQAGVIQFIPITHNGCSTSCEW